MYFNAGKAEFEAYVERLRAERDASQNGHYTPINFKGKFSRKTRSAFSRKMAMYNLRLLVFLSGLIFLAFYLYQTNIIDRAFRQFLDLFSKDNGLY